MTAPHHNPGRLALPALLIAGLLAGGFAVLVIGFRDKLRGQIHETIINRDASVLRPIVSRQLAHAVPADDLFATVLESSQQENMLAVVTFDARGQPLKFAPASLLFAELPLNDYLTLLRSDSISRYHEDFPLTRFFSGVSGATPAERTPVLEVLLPLPDRQTGQPLGFVQYYIDARPLARELAAIDERINRQTAATLGIGGALILVIVAVAYIRLRRAQHLIAERNASLVRANFELTLAAKVSAVGQITSHLVHGLQGSVTGLRSAVAGRDAGAPDWAAANSYADQMQILLQDALALLGDTATHTHYDLTGHELAGLIRRHNARLAEPRHIEFRVTGGFDQTVDNHRGGLLCLITGNLIQNAVSATPAGGHVQVDLGLVENSIVVTVTDEGPGIPPEIQADLFVPGKSGRAGGSGLGLAISRLLARQIGADLALMATGTDGTVFHITLPLESV